MNTLIILVGKFIAYFSRLLNRGSGSTWPGHIALSLNKNFTAQIVAQNPQLKLIFIVGTNGKTTTARMLATILKKSGKRVFENNAGANLLNGIASTFIHQCNVAGKILAEYAIFEVDENTLPLLLSEITPFAIVALNLYRDQLDRYGELDSIAAKWKSSFATLPKSTTVVLNADDPAIAYLGKDIHANVIYFGLQKADSTAKTIAHGADSIFCPRCQTRLTYDAIFYSHNGIWQCPNCSLKRPTVAVIQTLFPLPGLYNKYNTIAAVLLAKHIGIVANGIQKALVTVTPAFGRQEVLTYNGKRVQIFLSKNPTSFNESLHTVVGLGAKHIVLVLNDRIPDGRDVSWIWDIDLESYIEKFDHITISGDRTYDMGLRVEYSGKSQKNTNYMVEPNLESAIKKALEQIESNETLYILATYSAMLETRKILTGKKIL